MKSGQRKNEKGQVSIMIGMMMLTFILFFAFVVDTGMLVNAKINLQNAADLAAYAGAATQARQLTNISYLNYEMRRQYKKFLFRYYVIGNMAQDTQPPGTATNPVALSGPRQWGPTVGGPKYVGPSVCIAFKQDDDFCHVNQLPQIHTPASLPTDAINQALFDQLTALENIREQNCGSIAESNLQVLLTWLFNADPTLNSLQASLSDPTQAHVVDVIRGIADGVGLVPREAILRERIKTLNNYVNFPPQQGVTISQVNSLESANDQQAGERTIQAFLSAYNTLGDHIYSDDTQITMDELQPAQQLTLKDIRVDFDAYATVLELPIASNAASGSGGDCIPKLAPMHVPQLPVGVTKDTTTLTYYAVRLSAQAKILFSPFGPITMKAYAAARPFGSRIGPPASIVSQFVRPTNTPPTGNGPGDLVSTIVGGSVLGTFAGQVPNLPAIEGDGGGVGQGWDTNFVTGTMFNVMAVGAGKIISNQQAQHGYAYAEVPNPGEGNRYNIPNDNVGDLFVHNFDINHRMVFWAPVVSPDAGDAAATLKSDLAELFDSKANGEAATSTIAGGKNILGTGLAGTLSGALSDSILKYVTLMRNGQGENGEGVNLAVITDPFVDTSGGAAVTIVLPQIAMTDPTQYRSSFANINDNNIKTAGRVGYSVKIVSFDSLTQHVPNSDDAGTTPNNAMQMDGETERDVSSIRH